MFLGQAEDKHAFSSLAPAAWLRVPSALIRHFRIVVYNGARGSHAFSPTLLPKCPSEVSGRI
jgi:hypothetical protein